MTNRMIPTGMVQKNRQGDQSAKSGQNPNQTPDQRDAKFQPGRPAERRPTKSFATLVETNCSIRLSNGEQVNRLAVLSLKVSQVS